MIHRRAHVNSATQKKDPIGEKGNRTFHKSDSSLFDTLYFMRFPSVKGKYVGSDP